MIRIIFEDIIRYFKVTYHKAQSQKQYRKYLKWSKIIGEIEVNDKMTKIM